MAYHSSGALSFDYLINLHSEDVSELNENLTMIHKELNNGK